MYEELAKQHRVELTISILGSGFYTNINDLYLINCSPVISSNDEAQYVAYH